MKFRTKRHPISLRRTTGKTKGASHIVLLICMAICVLLSCQTQNRSNGEGFKSLSVQEYEKAIGKKNVVRLDVRTAKEFAEGHIEGAVNIDVLKSDFEKKATATLPRNKTIAVNCRSGKRSKTAAAILVKNGYRVVELDSGYNGWTNARKKTVKE